MDFIRSLLKWFSNHRLFSSILLTLLVILALGIRFVVNRSSGILSEPINQGLIIESVYGIGTVTAKKTFQIRPGVVTTINELYVEEGDEVKKGTPLLNIDQVVYHAPFSGIVAFLPYKVGENIFPQLPALALVDLEDRYLVVSLEQQGALRVKRGQKVKMSFDSIRDQSFEGKVEAVYSFNGSFLARVDVSKLPLQILPDMTADVAIEINRHENALLIPVAAFERGGVWVKRGNQIPFRVEVKTGIVDKDMAEIISGDLKVGDRLLIQKKAGS